MNKTKFMTRIFSAIKNGESDVLDQLDKDIELAKEDGKVEGDQYSITANDNGIVLHDKVNDEDTEIIEGENGNTTFAAKSFAKGGAKGDNLYVTIGDSDVIIDVAAGKATIDAEPEDIEVEFKSNEPLTKVLDRIKELMKSKGMKVFSSKGPWVVVAQYNPVNGVSYTTKTKESADELVAKSHGHFRNEIASKEFDTYKDAVAEQKKMTQAKLGKRHFSEGDPIQGMFSDSKSSLINSEISDDLKNWKSAPYGPKKTPLWNKLIADIKKKESLGYKLTKDQQYYLQLEKRNKGVRFSDADPTPEQEGVIDFLKGFVEEHPGEAKYLVELGAKWGPDNLLEGLEHDAKGDKTESKKFSKMADFYIEIEEALGKANPKAELEKIAKTRGWDYNDLKVFVESYYKYDANDGKGLNSESIKSTLKKLGFSDTKEFSDEKLYEAHIAWGIEDGENFYEPEVIGPGTKEELKKEQEVAKKAVDNLNKAHPNLGKHYYNIHVGYFDDKQEALKAAKDRIKKEIERDEENRRAAWESMHYSKKFSKFSSATQKMLSNKLFSDIEGFIIVGLDRKGNPFKDHVRGKRIEIDDDIMCMQEDEGCTKVKRFYENEDSEASKYLNSLRK